MDELAAERFRPLLRRPAPRGLYLMYEGYLIERLGPEIGGVLHSGRSRNDLKATITNLRFREWLLDFGAQAVRLEAVLLSRAREHQLVIMPVYTHFQAAMPVTYGYYLLGVAIALGREIDALRAAGAGLEICPLGAGAVAGTDLPINPARTAELLGFSGTAGHALDAVASRPRDRAQPAGHRLPAMEHRRVRVHRFPRPAGGRQLCHAAEAQRIPAGACQGEARPGTRRLGRRGRRDGRHAVH
jgi:argininosuccinate lyase